MSLPLPDYQYFIATASAVMQAIQTWISVRDRKKAAEVMQRTLSKDITDPQIAQEVSQLTSIVPNYILVTLTDRTGRCFQYYSEVLNSEQEYLPSEVDAATAAVKACVCRELKRVFELNGSIPPGKLEQWWDLYRCASL